MRSVLLACALCAGFAAALVPGLAKGSSQAQAQLTWAGWGDQVGEWWQTTPDGLRDTHFTLRIDNPGSVLAELSLNPVHADGSIFTSDWWDTSYKAGHWPLGVARNGGRLNMGFEPLCDPIDAGAPAVYELYAEDDGTGNVGTTFRVTMRFSDGSTLTADSVVTASASSLPAAPKPFVFPSVPRPDPNAACVAATPGAPPPTTTTPVTTTTVTTTPAPRPKPVAVCKKGQKSTAKKPCRKTKRY